MATMSEPAPDYEFKDRNLVRRVARARAPLAECVATMSFKCLVLVAAAIASSLCVSEPCVAADGEGTSAFDKIWGYATLYHNEDDRYLQRFALTGRLQTDSAWFDSDQGQFDDAFLWRRFRFGIKADVFRDWVVKIEGDFDLNESLGNSYTRLTDAFIGWNPSESLNLRALKQAAEFTLDGAIPSTKLLTMQRNNLSNNLWFVSEYFTGLTARGRVEKNWSYKAGVFSSDGSNELSRFGASYFTLLSLGYHLGRTTKLNDGVVRIDYVYNGEHIEANTRDFSHVLSLVTKWESGPWGLRTDLAAGTGYAVQSDVWGAVLMPSYDFNPRIQTVLRYTYVSSAGDNGVRLTRYADRIVSGRGNEYNEVYVGLNIHFYGQKLKWLTGLEYASMKDDANDGGEYKGWGLSTGLRMYW